VDDAAVDRPAPCDKLRRAAGGGPVCKPEDAIYRQPEPARIRGTLAYHKQVLRRGQSLAAQLEECLPADHRKRIPVMVDDAGHASGEGRDAGGPGYLGHFEDVGDGERVRGRAHFEGEQALP
jgi:hypothetical protein